MMNLSIYTWGTGCAFGRELGLPPNRTRRHHVSSSIIGFENGEMRLHLLVDAGAPCVETMIDSGITRVPDVLFITHPHADHVSDFDKLAISRMRGLKFSGQVFAPLAVVASAECIANPTSGLRTRFGYLDFLLKWLPIPDYDVWYSLSAADGELLPTDSVSAQDKQFPVSFKALPVYHIQAPGACLFIFRFDEPRRKIVFSGDFDSIEESVIENHDLRDPDAMVLETNTLKAVRTNHSNWEVNKELIARWVTGKTKSLILLNHLSGSEDYEQGYYDHIPTDSDWAEEIGRFTPPANTDVVIAEDGKGYPIG